MADAGGVLAWGEKTRTISLICGQLCCGEAWRCVYFGQSERAKEKGEFAQCQKQQRLLGSRFRSAGK
jgi:hypothetical protein